MKWLLHRLLRTEFSKIAFFSAFVPSNVSPLLQTCNDSKKKGFDKDLKTIYKTYIQCVKNIIYHKSKLSWFTHHMNGCSFSFLLVFSAFSVVSCLPMDERCVWRSWNISYHSVYVSEIELSCIQQLWFRVSPFTHFVKPSGYKKLGKSIYSL